MYTFFMTILSTSEFDMKDIGTKNARNGQIDTRHWSLHYSLYDSVRLFIKI